MLHTDNIGVDAVVCILLPWMEIGSKITIHDQRIWDGQIDIIIIRAIHPIGLAQHQTLPSPLQPTIRTLSMFARTSRTGIGRSA